MAPPAQHKARIVTESGRVESEIFVAGSDVTIKLAAGAEAQMRSIAKIKREVAAMTEGRMTVEQTHDLRLRLERYWLKRQAAKARGETPQIPGAKLLKIKYARTPTEIVEDTWDWLPSSDGKPAMVLGRCPECFFRAPSQVDPDQQTKPVFVEGRLGWMRGNPESDAKIVTFRLTHPLFTMWLDDKDRLTVREVVRCPSGRHGPEARLVGERCSWTVRVEDGLAMPVSGLFKTKPNIAGAIIK